MVKDTHPVINLLTQCFATIGNVKKVILFGSRARGDHNKHSDIDIAIEGENITDLESQMIYLLAEAAPTLLKIDCVEIHKLEPGAFLDAVERDGVILYERGKV